MGTFDRLFRRESSRPRIDGPGQRPVSARRAEAHENWTLTAEGTAGAPNPYWITTALDDGRFNGPQVDRDLGGAEPMVDLWEVGELVPTFEQVDRLAVLTGKPRNYFYQPTPALIGRLGNGQAVREGTPMAQAYRDMLQVVRQMEAADTAKDQHPGPSSG